MSRIDAPGLAPLATPGASSTAKQLVPTRSWRLLALLLCASICCWMYRFLPIILTEPIKRDLSLSDTHMGLITGFAFSLVYS
ncbi:MAG TPA: MFS transporter, partial [Sphingobium sp.]